MKTRLAAALLAAVALVSPALAEDTPAPSLDQVTLDEPLDPSAPVELVKLLDRWSKKLKLELVLDGQVAGVSLRLADPDRTLTWGLFKKALDLNDVVIEEREVDGKWLTFVHSRRNLATRTPPPFRIVDPARLPKREEIVTSLIPIRHGAGNDIFATVRGLLTRDVNRVGNILYVRGPEVMIVVDFAANVDYYSKVIHALDVKPAAPAPRVFKLERARAEDVARTLAKILGGPAFDTGPVAWAVASPNQAPRISADPRTNQLVVAAFPERLDDVARVVQALDAETSPLARESEPSFSEQLLRASGDLAALCLVGVTLLHLLSRRKVASVAP